MPISGVEVDVIYGGSGRASTQTDAKGDFDFQLPQPDPKTIQVRFRKAGYQAEDPLNVPTNKPLNMDMAKLK